MTLTASPPSNDDIDLSKRIQVQRSSKAFGSRAVSLVDLPAGSLFARITGASANAKKAYSSVQIGPNAHIELNSDLLYCNHSCDPSVVFNMSCSEVRVVDDKPLKVGDSITFFYPSTEWEMAQPFECTCGAEGVCKGQIAGARSMDEKDLKGYWLNPHIISLLEARKRKN